MADSPRAFPRYEVDAYVDVTASDVLLYHQIQNVSLGGICIQTTLLQDVGSLVDVVLNFPDLGTQMALQGQVVWVSREPPEEVGIRWVALDDERRDLLRKFIALVKRAEVHSGPRR